MSLEKPESLEEWQEYISTLSGMGLRDTGISANTLVFVKTLQDEGYSPGEITEILLSFAARIEEDGQVLPDGIPGEYTSYPDLMDTYEKQNESP